MRFQGRQTFQASRQKVWAFITHPEAACQCVPGFNSLEVESSERFRVNASVSMGTSQVNFDVTVNYDLLIEPQQARFQAVATAAANGGNGQARVTRGRVMLAEAENNSTRISWVVDMTVTGLIASLVDVEYLIPVHHLTAEFFECINQKLRAA